MPIQGQCDLPMDLKDGPEEVHANQLGRNLLKRAATRDDVDTKYFHA